MGVDVKYGIRNPRPTPSQQRLKQLLDYDPVTGVLTWKYHPTRKDVIGKACGTARNKDNYLSCNVDGYKYGAHRIVYKWMTGEEPKVIDHINGVADDNRWENLRSVTPQQNNFNMKLPKDNKSGKGGVFYHKRQKRWHSNVRVDGRSIHLGSWPTESEAIASRKTANKLFGFSERHGE